MCETGMPGLWQARNDLSHSLSLTVSSQPNVCFDTITINRKSRLKIGNGKINQALYYHKLFFVFHVEFSTLQGLSYVSKSIVVLFQAWVALQLSIGEIRHGTTWNLPSFLKDVCSALFIYIYHVKLKTGVMMLKIHSNKLHFILYLKKTTCLKL